MVTVTVGAELRLLTGMTLPSVAIFFGDNKLLQKHCLGRPHQQLTCNTEYYSKERKEKITPFGSI